MGEFHHTVENMIWVRGNENAIRQMRRIDLRPLLPADPRLPASVRQSPPQGTDVEFVYGDTLENFVLDFGPPYEGLPEGIDERIYRQGVFHALNRQDVGTVDGGPMPWFYGDQAIADLPQLLQRQVDRQPSPPEPPTPPPPPMIISRRQFYQAAALRGMITQEEALDAVRTGKIPALMQQGIDTLPPDEKFNAEMMLSGAGEFDRNHPMVDKFGEIMGFPPNVLDDMWHFAETL